jgi:hypothetical protein
MIPLFDALGAVPPDSHEETAETFMHRFGMTLH